MFFPLIDWMFFSFFTFLFSLITPVRIYADRTHMTSIEREREREREKKIKKIKKIIIIKKKRRSKNKSLNHKLAGSKESEETADSKSRSQQ